MKLVDTTESLKNARLWSHFLQGTRDFFETRDYLELWTPQLGDAGALEGTIDTLKVSGNARQWELQVSPEVEMKHFLSQNAVSVFQICKCFRDDPNTGIHLPEFTMLEFYEVGATWDEVRERTRELVTTLQGRDLPVEIWDVSAIVRDVTGIDLATKTDRHSLAESVTSLGIHVGPSDSWEDLFFKIMVEKIEPSLDPNALVFLTGYPSAVSPMSTPLDGFRAQRFELFWQGMELANGCTELSDRELLYRKLANEQRLRQESGKAAHEIPSRLKAAFERGLPPCAGVAIGLERLFACLMRTSQL